MARRSKIDAEKTREQLLVDATYLFTTKGYADSTIADICERSGITKGGLFHYFKTKEDLFFEVWTRVQTQMDDEARDAGIAGRSDSDPYAAFLAGCRVYLNWTARDDYRTIVIIDGPSVLGQAKWYQYDHALGIKNVEAGMRYLSKQRIIASRHVSSLAQMVQGALNGAGFAIARGEEGVTPDTAYEAFEALVRSLR